MTLGAFIALVAAGVVYSIIEEKIGALLAFLLCSILFLFIVIGFTPDAPHWAQLCSLAIGVAFFIGLFKV